MNLPYYKTFLKLKVFLVFAFLFTMKDMENPKTPDQSEIMRLLPSVDVLLRTATVEKLVTETGAKHLTILA